ncbi:MAG: ABC transporter substrate binding protein [bacterium]
MKKRLFTIIYLFVTTLLLLNTPCHALDQAAISVVFSSDMEEYHQAWEGFNGFFMKNGVDLSVSTHNLANNDMETICSKIKKEKPQLILAIGTKALKLLKMGIQDIPILGCMVMNQYDLEQTNVTGVTMSIPTNIKLEWINRNIPQAKTIGLIYSTETTELAAKISQDCNKFGYKVIVRKINSGKEIAEALQGMGYKIDCFLMIPDASIYFSKSIEYLLMEGLKKKFAIIGLSSHYTKAGAFASFDCDYKDIGRQTAEMAMKILNGQSLTINLPPESPFKTTFSLNLLVAEKIGIKLQPSTIKEAKGVFGR